MATKDSRLSFKDNRKIFVNNGVSNNQYSNLNLNQNYQLPSNVYQGSKTFATDNKKIQNYAILDSSDINDSQKRTNSSISQYHSKNALKLNIDQNPKKEEFRKRNISNKSNNSTLSLHIAAYENSIENTVTDKMDDDHEGLKKNNKPGSLKKLKALTDSKSFSQESFEIPRQQKEDKAIIPEVMKFKARQKLFPPNASSLSKRKCVHGSIDRCNDKVVEKEKMTPPKSPDKKLDDDQLCILAHIKEIYQKASDIDNEMWNEKPPTEEEFKAFLTQAIVERAKIEPSVSYDVLKEEIIELFKSEDQYSTFIACCENMMETNTTMRQIIRLMLNVINFIKHTPAYKISYELQTLSFNRDDLDTEQQLDGSFFYDDIDPKEQQKSKKRSKKRKLKKIAEEEAATVAAAENEMIEEGGGAAGGGGDECIPKLEEILYGIDFSSSDIQITEDASPDLPKISPEDYDIAEKAQEICDIITGEIFHILSVFSETRVNQQIDVLNREILYLRKKAAANTAYYEKREAEIKAGIKDLAAKNEAENREQQKLEAQIRTLEAEIEKIEERKEDIVKKIEKVDDSTFIKYKTQWQNTIKRFHELEEEVKNVSCTIRREKQSFSDLSNAARREDEIFKKEIEALEAAVVRKQAQLESCEARLETENQKQEDERKKLVNSIQMSEKAILQSTYEREKLNLGRSITKAQENISQYRKALEKEDDPIRRDILTQHHQQWETYKLQVRSSKQCLDTLYNEKSEQLEKGGNLYDICQFDYPQFHASATPLNDLILPPRVIPPPPATVMQAFSHSHYLPPTFHHQQQLPPPQQQLSQQQQFEQHIQQQLQQQTPQRFRYPPNSSGPPLYVVPVPYNPPTASQSDHAAYISSTNEYNRNQQLMALQQHRQQQNGTETDVYSHGDTVVPQQYHHQQQQYPEVKPHAPHSAPVMGSSRSHRYPIGVVPPNYNFVQNDKIWVPPPDNNSELQPRENNPMNENSDVNFQHAFRQNSNESFKEAGGATKIPFQAHELVEGKYPIGVIPPFYVTNNGFEWTPPLPRSAADGKEMGEQVFKFPPSNDLFDSDH